MYTLAELFDAYNEAVAQREHSRWRRVVSMGMAGRMGISVADDYHAQEYQKYNAEAMRLGTQLRERLAAADFAREFAGPAMKNEVRGAWGNTGDFWARCCGNRDRGK